MEEEITLDLRDILYIVRKRFRLIIFITLICTLAAGLVSFFLLKPIYQAETSIIVGKPQETMANQSQTQYNDVMMYQKLVKTYAQIAQSKATAEMAANKLEGKYTIKQIQKSVTVSPQTDTQILIISAQSGDAYEAVKMVNTVADSFIEESKLVFPTGGTIQIMDKPSVPTSPVKPNKVLNIAVAFLIGLMGSLGLTLVLEYMDRTIKSEEDIERYLDIPVVGVIAKEN